MKDVEAQDLVKEIKKEYPHAHVVISNQPGRSSSWSIVEVHASPTDAACFTLTSVQEWKRLQEIMQILAHAAIGGALRETASYAIDPAFKQRLHKELLEKFRQGSLKKGAS